MRSTIAMVLLSLFVLGCSTNYKVEVESDTSWAGFVGNRSVEGNGPTTVDLGTDGGCAVLYKNGEEGYLEARVVADGGGIFNPGDTDWVYTSASHGTVVVCSKGSTSDHHHHPHDSCDCGSK